MQNKTVQISLSTSHILLTSCSTSLSEFALKGLMVDMSTYENPHREESILFRATNFV